MNMRTLLGALAAGAVYAGCAAPEPVGLRTADLGTGAEELAFDRCVATRSCPWIPHLPA
jgi:hypothetical protein